MFLGLYDSVVSKKLRLETQSEDDYLGHYLMKSGEFSENWESVMKTTFIAAALSRDLNINWQWRKIILTLM